MIAGFAKGKLLGYSRLYTRRLKNILVSTILKLAEDWWILNGMAPEADS